MPRCHRTIECSNLGSRHVISGNGRTFHHGSWENLGRIYVIDGKNLPENCKLHSVHVRGGVQTGNGDQIRTSFEEELQTMVTRSRTNTVMFKLMNYELLAMFRLMNYEPLAMFRLMNYEPLTMFKLKNHLTCSNS